MWDIDYIKRQSGAREVEVLNESAIACTPPDGGTPVIVTAKRVDGGRWMLVSGGTGLGNPASTVNEAVQCCGRWPSIFAAVKR